MIRKATCVYVDGFNVYFAIRYTPYRWLDLGRLASVLVPNAEIRAIRYFTARIEARGDPTQPARQDIYLRALSTIPNLTIHYGQFLSNQIRMGLVKPPLIGPQTALVWKTEEKGSDVNLAAYLLADGFKARYEQAVVVSNDTDLLRPIEMVRDDLRRQVIVAISGAICAGTLLVACVGSSAVASVVQYQFSPGDKSLLGYGAAALTGAVAGRLTFGPSIPVTRFGNFPRGARDVG